MKKIIYTLLILGLSLSLKAQLQVSTSGNKIPKFVGKHGSDKFRFKDLKLGFTKTDEENSLTNNMKTIYVIFNLSPKNGANYPPQNSDYLSRIYKLTNLPSNYDPKSFSVPSIINGVKKDFLKYCAETYKLNPEHYNPQFEAYYNYKKMEESLTSMLEYNQFRTYVIDYDFSFSYKDNFYSYTYSPN